MKTRLPLYIDAQIGDYCNSDVADFWLPLPVTKKEFEAALRENGMEDAYTLRKKYRVNVPGLTPMLLSLYPLPRVNFLAARLATLDEEDITKLMAIMDTRHAFTDLEEYINFTYSTKQYTLIPGVRNEADLGQYYLESAEFAALPEVTQNYFNAHDLGVNLTQALGGEFTSQGYIMSRNDWNALPPKRKISAYFDLTDCLPYDSYDLEWGANLRINRPFRRPEWMSEKYL